MVDGDISITACGRPYALPSVQMAWQTRYRREPPATCLASKLLVLDRVDVLDMVSREICCTGFDGSGRRRRIETALLVCPLKRCPAALPDTANGCGSKQHCRTGRTMRFTTARWVSEIDSSAVFSQNGNDLFHEEVSRQGSSMRSSRSATQQFSGAWKRPERNAITGSISHAIGLAWPGRVFSMLIPFATATYGYPGQQFRPRQTFGIVSVEDRPPPTIASRCCCRRRPRCGGSAQEPLLGHPIWR